MCHDQLNLQIFIVQCAVVVVQLGGKMSMWEGQTGTMPGSSDVPADALDHA